MDFFSLLVFTLSGEKLLGELGGIIFVEHGRVIYEDLEWDTKLEMQKFMSQMQEYAQMEKL